MYVLFKSASSSAASFCFIVNICVFLDDLACSISAFCVSIDFSA
ncbi:hypothetical protein MCHI_003744 [Candidatus Magnetoovum chiemensis]|nr:hypothetical protein MCHI_003744 [Candidatus Magnetoovum chiemensis]